jgi:hypothetical protein
MNIPLTKEQYMDLVKVVHLGDWLVNSYREEEESMEFKEIGKHIFSFAKEFGMDDVLKFDEKIGTIVPTAEFEEEVISLSDEYDYEVFWEKLIEELANRDMLMDFSEAEIKEMDEADKVLHLEKYGERYSKEFEKTGISNLILKV